MSWRDKLQNNIHFFSVSKKSPTFTIRKTTTAMNKAKPFFFRRASYFLITIVLSIIILQHGQFILGPLAFAMLFTIMIQPVCNLFERLVKKRIPAVLLALLSVLIVLGTIIMVFSIQFSNIIQDLPDITQKIANGIQRIIVWLRENIGLTESDIQQNIPKLVDNSMAYIQKGIMVSTTFLFNAFLTLLFTFFLLWYRNSIRNFLLIQASEKNRNNFKDILYQIKKTIQGYLYGLLIVMAILAVLNSVGLMIIGIDYAVFWGVLAALLAVIPYIGTTLGGTLPFIYAVATTDNWWQPLAVVGMYVVIQNLEGNIITPNIVGSSVAINPLVALMALIVGGFIWGIGGIILAIPVAAIVKVIFEHQNQYKPIALLMSNKVHKNENEFMDDFDNDRHRLKR